MSSSQNKKIFDPDKLRVLVICLEDKLPAKKLESELAVRRLLGKHCRFDWENQGQIGLHSIPFDQRNDAPRFRRWLDQTVPDENDCHVFVQNEIIVEPAVQDTRGLRKITQFPSIQVLESRLLAVLKPQHLDWISELAQSVKGQWMHGGGVDREHLERWLQQFERLGERWIGEGLLKSLDFWSIERQNKSLDISLETLNQFSHICVNLERPGKSGGVLAAILRKHAKSLKPEFPDITDFRELLATSKNEDACTNIIFVEDGLFTGTETTNFLSGLLGLKHPKGRSWTTRALPDVKTLIEKNIVLKFAVVTAMGVGITNQFLAQENLKNISIDLSSHGGYIQNMTAAGEAALADGTIWAAGKHKILTNTYGHLVRPCFNNLDVWKTADRARRAMDFCEAIGLQLFRQYLNWKKYSWEDERVRMCGLGMNGFGLLLAFNHSVPKASLPLLWMDGRIRYEANGINCKARELDWIPLFPNGKV